MNGSWCSGCVKANCCNWKLIYFCQSTTLHIKLHTFLMHLRSSSAHSDALCIRLCMLHNSAPPPASTPLHMLPLLVCLFVSPSGLFPLIDGQWTSAKSDCTHSIRRVLSR